jgi:hypothetical protein
MSTEAGDTVSIEDRAKSMGWAPKEEWRGAPEKWIDAEVFVERGESILPILKATNRHLQDDMSALRNELSAAKSALQNSVAAIEELKKFNSDANRQKMKESKEALVKQLKEARAEGNLDAEVEISDQLDNVRAAERDAAKPPSKPNGDTAPPQNDPTKNPDYQAWLSDNPWFESNARKRALAVAIAAELREDPAYKGVTGRKFFDKVTEETEKTLGGPAPVRRTTKVESPSQAGGDGGPRKSYADLPTEAKQACDKMADRLVGPKNKGFAYEALKDWREKYVNDYFQE